MKLGRFQLHRISDGELRLDGGAMFGIVPRVLWERKTEPDERNRVRLGLNCLLIRTGNENILVDTGCGNKYSQKELDIYGIVHPTDVVGELRRVGLQPEDLDFVINTHFHFDHCGGNTRWQGDAVVPTFPRATYVVRREEYEAATHINQRTAGSYFSHNWESVENAGKLQILEQDGEIVPGVSVVHTPGHTLGHQSVRVESEGQIVFYLADLCPTSVHVPLPWIMGYDLFPLTTLEIRKRIYRQAIEEEWLLFFEHDPKITSGYLSEKEGRFALEPSDWDDS